MLVRYCRPAVTLFTRFLCRAVVGARCHVRTSLCVCAILPFFLFIFRRVACAPLLPVRLCHLLICGAAAVCIAHFAALLRAARVARISRHDQFPEVVVIPRPIAPAITFFHEPSGVVSTTQSIDHDLDDTICICISVVTSVNFVLHLLTPHTTFVVPFSASFVPTHTYRCRAVASILCCC